MEQNTWSDLYRKNLNYQNNLTSLSNIRGVPKL